MLSVIPTTLLLLPHFLKGEKTGAPRNKDPFLILVKVFNFLKIVFKFKKKIYLAVPCLRLSLQHTGSRRRCMWDLCSWGKQTLSCVKWDIAS